MRIVKEAVGSVKDRVDLRKIGRQRKTETRCKWELGWQSES